MARERRVRITDLLPEAGRPIAYFPRLREITGSTNAALLLCQLLYWYGKQHNTRGWIAKHARVVRADPDGALEAANQSVERETGLTYKELKVARRALQARGFLEERRLYMAHQIHFRLDLAAIQRAWNRLGEGLGPKGTVGKSQRDRWKVPKGPLIKGINRDYPENTSESPTTTAAADSNVGDRVTAKKRETMPLTPLEAMQHPDIQLFMQICGRVPGVDQYRVVIETVRYFHAQQGEETAEYLQPFWLEWAARLRRSDGRPYDPASLTWLTEWAMNGAIPPQNGGTNDKNRPNNSQSEASHGANASDRLVASRINSRRRRRS